MMPGPVTRSIQDPSRCKTDRPKILYIL